MENMRRCVDWYLPGGSPLVVDIGAADVNGSYRALLPAASRYVGVDLEPGPGVDLVLDDPYHLPFEDGSVDVILSGQMLEHCGQFWRVFSEVARVLRPEGLAFMIAPSAGPVHRYPVDCYRFYPDSFAACADWAGLRLVHSWTDERGPWRDIVGVFQRAGRLEARTEPPVPSVPEPAALSPHPDPAAEAGRGARPYLDVLKDLHAIVAPRTYLEIGVRKGASLALSTAPSIAIDPAPELASQGPDVALYRCTSDDFFFFHARAAVTRPVDLAFLDGMHLAEYLYRDFINVERIMRPGGAVVIDDVLPSHPVQARRERTSRAWTGDVWRFAELLAEKRPDLDLTWLDAAPSGLLLVTGLSPSNRVLWDNYNPLLRTLSETADRPVPAAILSRRAAVAPTAEALRKALGR